MVLVPEHYAGSNVIFVKKPMIRTQITQGVRSIVLPENRQGVIAEAELQRIDETGLVSPLFLDTPAVRQVLAAMERDLMRTSREVNAIQAARSLSDAGVLLSLWRPVPPVGGKDTDPWLTVTQAARRDAERAGAPDAGGDRPRRAAARRSARPGSRCRTPGASRTRRPPARRSNTLAQNFALVEPRLYPAAARLSWEHWYYKNDKMTAVWIIYFFALPFLLMADGLPVPLGAGRRADALHHRLRAADLLDRPALVAGGADPEREHVRGGDRLGLVRRAGRDRAGGRPAALAGQEPPGARGLHLRDVRADDRALHAGRAELRHHDRDAGARPHDLALHPHQHGHRLVRADLLRRRDGDALPGRPRAQRLGPVAAPRRGLGRDRRHRGRSAAARGP